jgi:outer membrane lipoprotein SlyB
MRRSLVRISILPLVLAVGLGACASNGVQPGIVYTSGVPSGSGPGPGPYGGGGGPYYGNGPYPPQQQAAYPQYPQQAASVPAQGSNYPGGPGDAGRVVSIREVALAGGSGGYGMSHGTVMGGILGAGTGATIGAITSQTLGGGIVGALIGLVGGAIAGTIASGPNGGGGYGTRGIEVTVQRDDGQQVTVAQRDDGDIQLGDRVQIVQNRQGVAQVVRDATRRPD